MNQVSAAIEGGSVIFGYADQRRMKGKTTPPSITSSHSTASMWNPTSCATWITDEETRPFYPQNGSSEKQGKSWANQPTRF